MQQRVNRWLNPDLCVAVHEQGISEATAFRTSDQCANSDFLSAPTTRPTGARRFWQHAAAFALLLGSAAFSYVAWSETPMSLSVSAIVDHSIAIIRAPDGSADDSLSDHEYIQGLRQGQVMLLREENQLLRERLEQLQARLSDPNR